MNGDLVTRAELANMAQREGLGISVRTLRYWAQEGLIPPARKIPGRGNRVFYPCSLLTRLRMIRLLRPTSTEQLKKRLEDIEQGPPRLALSLKKWRTDGAEFDLSLSTTGLLVLTRYPRRENDNG